MNAYSFSFTWKGRRHSFIPNRVFWVLLLTTFASLAGWAANLGAEHYELRQQLDALSAGSPSDAEALIFRITQGRRISSGAIQADELAPSFMLALTALVSLILRKLIGWFLKLNNVLLLTGARMDALQPIEVKLGRRTMQFQPGRHFWKIVAGCFLLLFGTIGYLSYSQSQMSKQISLLKLKSAGIDQIDTDGAYKDDIVGYLIDYFNEYESNRLSQQQNFREAFLMEKQLLISQYVIKEKVANPKRISEQGIIEVNEKLAKLFKEKVLDKTGAEEHVYKFFTDDSDLNKIETALMEQHKYGVPASITLAQAALETAYGRRVMHNNYFGIKDKEQSPKGYMTTTEYYTAKEVSLNKSKIISKKKVDKGGKVLYKCTVKDSFVRYNTPWASFRAHSLFLANNPRYYYLFTKNGKYEEWADKIGSTKYGGVGYATSPIYGELLKKIIRRYGLDALDS